MTNRHQQKRQTRYAFFQAVLDLSMSGQAFSAMSLRQVTRQVGVVPTAFYRHFESMDALGRALVTEALGQALHTLREHLQLGQTRTNNAQIATSVQLFFESIDSAPLYWHFIVSERYGGNHAVHDALMAQIRLFVQLLADDLGMQPAFGKISEPVRLLIADMGVNLFFSWVHQWLTFKVTDTDKRQAYLQRCIQQAQILFYGVTNWRDKAI